jgi:hypothetical protein
MIAVEERVEVHEQGAAEPAIGGGSLPPWVAEPYRLWSLFDMQTLFANHVVAISTRLSELGELAKNQAGSLSGADGTSLITALAKIRPDCESIGLESSLDQIHRIARLLTNKNVKHSEIAEHIRDLQRRFADDLGRTLCLFIAHDKAKYWRTGQLFGPEVFERLPLATVDIEEAGKCLACQRGTAAVFHLMRVMEVGLKETAAALGIPYAPSWESYLKQIERKISQDWPAKKAEWKKDEPFFREVLGQLTAVKVAWRNPTMHVVNDYTPEQAEEIFTAVRSFMRHLAAKLPNRQAGGTPVAPGG